MGQPQITVAFRKAAETANTRSARGVACVVIKDTAVTGLHTYTRKAQIKESYTDSTFKEVLEEGFTKYGTNTIKVVSIGEDGTIDDVISLIKKVEINYLAFDYELSEEDITKLKAFKELRVKNNMDLQIILAGKEVDDKYFINYASTGLKINNVAMTPERLTIKAAFIFSALPANKSATYFVLDDVTAVDEIEDEDAAADQGKLIILFDGEKFKFGRAVNSMTTLGTEDKPSMKKIKVVENSILVKCDLAKIFRDEYVSLDNNFDNRTLYAGNATEYLRILGQEGVVNKDANNYIEMDVEEMRNYIEKEVGVDTSKMSDTDILKDVDGYLGSHIFPTGNVRYSDAMEDMDMKLFF